VNVRLLLTAITLPLFVSGCASFGNLFGGTTVKPVEIQTKAVERTPLNLRLPDPFRARDMEWIIITPDNAEEVWKRLRDSNTDLVLFSVTDDGYETLALTMAELRNIIAQQSAIILKYKEYYEPGKPAEPAKQSQ
jgi:hypothetical protein